MVCQLWVIGIVMFVAGMLGGIVNYFLSDPAEERPMPWWKHATIGVAAAFMVPLFLNMISGDLIDKIRGTNGSLADYSKIFVLAGFCLAASVSSRAFIGSMSHRLLQAVKSANEKSSDAKELAEEAKVEAVYATARAAEAKAVVDPLIEEDEKQIDTGHLMMPASMMESTPTKDELDVLKAMIGSGFTMRSLSGISKDSGVPKERVNSAISTLLQSELIGQTMSNNGQPRWYPTPKGRAALVGAV